MGPDINTNTESQPRPQLTPAGPRRTPWWPVLISILVVPAYTTLAVVQVPAEWGMVHSVAVAFREFWFRQTEILIKPLGLVSQNHYVSYGCYLWLMAALIPALFMVSVLRWDPRKWGLRSPNRLAWRLLPLCVLVSLPFLYWMAHNPDFDGYRRQLERDTVPALVHYALNMGSEHIFMHGIVLALFLPGWCWPERVLADPDQCEPQLQFQSPDELLQSAGGARMAGPLRRAIQHWLGFAHTRSPYPGRTSPVSRWLGLPPACLFAIVMSGILFGFVHTGKYHREMLLSYPGGAFSAYLALRTNSLLTPFILHASTAAITVGILFLEARG